MRWTIETRAAAGCRRDSVQRASSVFGEQSAAPLAARLVPVAVDSDLVACSRDLADELRVHCRLLAADEEQRGRPGTVERLEHGRRALRMWAVVEAEQDAAAAREPRRDPERARRLRQDGCCRRRPLRDEGAARRERQRAPYGQDGCRAEASRCTDEIASPALSSRRIDASS